MTPESFYSQLTNTANDTPQQPTASVLCPPGSRWNASMMTCIPDDRPSAVRRDIASPVVTAIPPVSFGQVGPPQMMNDSMGDALGTVKSIGMGVLNVLTLIGAIGGLAYIWSNRGNIFHTWSRPGYWKGRRAARKGR